MSDTTLLLNAATADATSAALTITGGATLICTGTLPQGAVITVQAKGGNNQWQPIHQFIHTGSKNIHTAGPEIEMDIRAVLAGATAGTQVTLAAHHT